MSPYEAWTGEKPVSNLKKFGCPVFILNNEVGKRKFDDRSKRGIFVGYTEETKGYRVWIPEERKVVISRDIIFREGKNTLENPQDQPYPEIIDEVQMQNNEEDIKRSREVVI